MPSYRGSMELGGAVHRRGQTVDHAVPTSAMDVDVDEPGEHPASVEIDDVDAVRGESGADLRDRITIDDDP